MRTVSPMLWKGGSSCQTQLPAFIDTDTDMFILHVGGWSMESRNQYEKWSEVHSMVVKWLKDFQVIK